MKICKVEVESHEHKYGMMYEVHIYLVFQKEPEILYLPTWAEGYAVIASILDFLKLLVEKDR